MNLVDVSCRVWFSIEACDSISCWGKWSVVGRDSVDCRDRDWSAERCTSLSLSLRLNIFSRSWVFASSRVFIDARLTSSCFSLLICSICRTIQCSLHFKVMSRWSLSSSNILMTSFEWSIAHWRSCSSILMFHEVAAFWGSAEASKERRETRLFAVLLSRRAVRGPTGSESRAIVRKVKIDRFGYDKVEWLVW